MFHEHAVDVSGLLRGSNEVAIRFSSLNAFLEARRPRPRWRTALVDQQKLRWFRTTLLGRMPGWSPRVEAIGPWRGVVLQEREGSSGRASVRADARERGGRRGVDVLACIRSLDGTRPPRRSLQVGDSRADWPARRSRRASSRSTGGCAFPTSPSGGRAPTANSPSTR